METYDLVMLGLLVAATFLGAVKGLAWQIASLTSMIASYWVARQFHGEISPHIDIAQPWNTFVAMLILYVATSAAIWVLFRMMASAIDRMRMKDFDRQLGALLGFGKGVLLCMIITLFAVTLLGESVRQAIIRSKSGNYIARLMHDAGNVMPPELKSVLEPYLKNFDERMVAPAQIGEAGGESTIPGGRQQRVTDDPTTHPGSSSTAKSTWENWQRETRREVMERVENGVRSGVERSAERAFDGVNR